jgi:hypothetical protein
MVGWCVWARVQIRVQVWIDIEPVQYLTFSFNERAALIPACCNYHAPCGFGKKLLHTIVSGGVTSIAARQYDHARMTEIDLFRQVRTYSLSVACTDVVSRLGADRRALLPSCVTLVPLPIILAQFCA